MDKVPRISDKEKIVLRLLLNRGEMYGLELVKASPEIKRGAVYVMLSRMSDKGLVSSRLIGDELVPGKKRPRYSITGIGQQVLRFSDEQLERFNDGGALA